MRRFTALLLALVLALGLMACASDDAATTTPDTAGDTTADTASDAADTGDTGSTGDSADNASDAAADGETFLLGTYLQLTGSNAVAGTDAQRAIDLAVKYINENGGFNGVPVEVLHYDTTGSTEEAVKVVQRMLSSDNVDAVVGSVNSNEVSACISYLNEAKVYNFGLGTSATWMEDPEMVYTFRASANNGRVAPVDVDVIMSLGYDTVAIINGTDDTGASTADAFEAACAEKGLTVTTRQQCDTDDTDFSGQIAQILATDPDCIFMSTIGQTTGPFVKQVRNMGYRGIICFKDCFSQEYQAIAGAENSNYVIFAYPYVVYESIEDCNIEPVREFLELYYNEYGEMIQHEAAYRGWDTMMVMWEASKIAGSNDSEALREATNQVVIDGLGGTLDYTNGDREGYAAFNGFIKMDNVDLLFSDWLADGGYEAYLEATGNEK